MPTISRKVISAERARELLDYSPETGEFRRRTGKYAGDIAGAFCEPGYRRIYVDGASFYAHRLAWLIVYGFIPHELDHINLDKADNRICNLRMASRNLNCTNKRVRSSFGFKGVSRQRRKRGPDKWCAYIKVNGKSVWLGMFDLIEDAAAAYRAAAKSLYGDICFA